MKHLLIILFCITSAIQADAQMGPGIVFTYNGAGLREKREFRALTSLVKPGKNDGGQPADTIIGMYKDNENNAQEARIFVRAYPNPVHDILFVENLSWTEGSSATLKLSDVSGKQILEKNATLPNENISLSNLAPGTYHVKYYKDNVYIISWQIVKL